MKVPRPSPDDLAYFRGIIPDDPRVEVKPMFGNLGAFVNGNMFAGLFGSAVGVKLNPDDHPALVAAVGGPFGPAERPMSGYVSLPPAWRDDPDQHRSLGGAGPRPRGHAAPQGNQGEAFQGQSGTGGA